MADKSTPNLTVHAPKELRVMVAASHGDTDAAIAGRIRAVSAALKSGTDIKTLAADLAADEADGATDTDGNPVVAVSASLLGYARGVLTTLDRVGITLPRTGGNAALAMTYRACKRHGVKSTPAKLATDAANGETTADKLAILAEAATALYRTPVAAKSDDKSGDDKSGDKSGDEDKSDEETVRTLTAPVDASELVKLLTVAAGSVAAGRIRPDAATLTAVEALMAEVKRALRPVATPATVAAK